MSTWEEYSRHMIMARRTFGLLIVEASEGDDGCFAELIDDTGYSIVHRMSAEVLISMAPASKRRKRAAIQAVKRHREARQEREPRWEGGAEEHSYRML